MGQGTGKGVFPTQNCVQELPELNLCLHGSACDTLGVGSQVLDVPSLSVTLESVRTGTRIPTSMNVQSLSPINATALCGLGAPGCCAAAPNAQGGSERCSSGNAPERCSSTLSENALDLCDFAGLCGHGPVDLHGANPDLIAHSRGEVEARVAGARRGNKKKKVRRPPHDEVHLRISAKKGLKWGFKCHFVY